MYDDSPQSYGTVEELRGVLDDSAGDLTLVDSADFTTRYWRTTLTVPGS